MGKLEVFAWVICCVVITYLVATANMGWIVGLSSNASATITASDNHGAFGTTTAALDYWPLALYLIPAVWGIGILTRVLKSK